MFCSFVRVSYDSVVPLGWVEIFEFQLGWVGLGQPVNGPGWIGSHKMDPWTTLSHTVQVPVRELNRTRGVRGECVTTRPCASARY